MPKKTCVLGVWVILLFLVWTVESPGQVLRFGTHVSSMGNLDPHFAFGSQDRAFSDMVFNGLLRYVPGNAPRIEPDLASALPEFHMEDGEQVWRIHLRSGVMFHGGPGGPAHEMTADDVVFSLEKAAQKEYSGYAGEYQTMTVEKKGRYLVEIRFNTPISPILFFPKITNYGGGFILSKRAVETLGYEGFKQHPIGTGPFAFDSHSPGEVLKLKPHGAYFRGRPKLSGVWLYFIPDAEERLSGLMASRLDVITGSGERGWISTAEFFRNVVVDTHGVGEVGTLYFNTAAPPMDDIRVRRALAYALDRDAFYRTADSRIAGKVYSPVPSAFLPGGLKQSEVESLGLDYAMDLSRARSLLSQAGYPNGFELDLVASEKRVYQAYYRTLKRLLVPIGIQCRIWTVPHSEMHRIIRKEPPPLVVYAAWRPNADAYLTRFFHSESRVVAGVRPDTNFSQYGAVDGLIEAARKTVDPETQLHLWGQSQIRILDDMVALPLMFTRQVYARTPLLDYGHPVVSTMALYPQFTENTHFISPKGTD